MRRLALRLVLAPLALALVLALHARAEEIRFDAAHLPRGATVTSDEVAGPRDVEAIAKKLDARIARIERWKLSLRGFEAQVNVLAAPDGKAADALEAALCRVKNERPNAPATIARSGETVLEVVGKNPMLAKRLFASLGIVREAPAHYQSSFRVACVESLDYMRANLVFERFLAPDGGTRERDVAALAKGWRFGGSIALWKEGPTFRATYEVTPSATAELLDRPVFKFASPPRDVGIPYVDVQATTFVTARYRPEPDARPGAARLSCLGATPRFPAEAPAIRELAARLRAVSRAPPTRGLDLPVDKASDLDRLDAILAHVHATIRPDGPHGSRHGVEKALAQGFGRCWDCADAVVTLCRAAGIPAREVAGWVPPLGAGHVWAEAYVDGGWLPVDATTPWLGASDDYVPWFETDDGEMPIVYLAMPEVRRLD